MKIYKKWWFWVIIIVVITPSLWLFNTFGSIGTIYPHGYGEPICEGYEGVGVYEGKIASEEEARQILLNYFSNADYPIGVAGIASADKFDKPWYDFSDTWQLRMSRELFRGEGSFQMCMIPHNSIPQYCVGQTYKMEDNKILREYGIPC